MQREICKADGDLGAGGSVEFLIELEDLRILEEMDAEVLWSEIQLPEGLTRK